MVNRRADLRRADLRVADLRVADLRVADLRVDRRESVTHDLHGYRAIAVSDLLQTMNPPHFSMLIGGRDATRTIW